MREKNDHKNSAPDNEQRPDDPDLKHRGLLLLRLTHSLDFMTNPRCSFARPPHFGHMSNRGPMERFFSLQNIEYYRKLLDISTDEPERRLLFELLAVQAIQMDTRSLTVRVERRDHKYTWELHRDGHFHPVKFSVPVYVSEEAARAAAIST